MESLEKHADEAFKGPLNSTQHADISDNDRTTALMEFIPGTVHLVDLAGTLKAAHADGSSSRRDVVLVPAPSADPEDPLNWPQRRKVLATVCNCVYTLMVGIASAAIYSVLEPISAATSLSIADLNAGTGYMFLAFGWGCLFFQPLAQKVGKRGVYLFSILATCGIQVWAPYTKNNGQWIANKVLQGFVGAPIESLCEITMADIWFQHERGTFISLYGLLLAGSNFFAPIISGFIADGQGWRWVLYWSAIFCGAGAVFLFFFMEETNYLGRVPALPLSGTSTPPEDSTPPPLSPAAGANNKTKSYIARLSLLDTRSLSHPPLIPPLRHLLRPLTLLSFPVILFSGWTYGSALVVFNILNATASSILSHPPYNFPPSLVGLSYVAAVLGVALGALWCGPVGDRLVLRAARRNAGLHEPEHRLYLLLPSLLLVPAGLLLWGVGASRHVHWFGLLVGMAIIAATNTIGLAVGLAYAIDSYRGLGPQVVVAVILVRNSMSFGINYGITPWIANMGLQNAFIMAAMLGMASTATVLIFIKWGKAMRSWRWSRERYARYLREEGGDGTTLVK